MVEHQFATDDSSHTDAGPPGPGAVLDELRHAAAVLAKTDWHDLPGEIVGELVEPFGEVRNTLDAVDGAMLAAYDTSASWRRSGSRSCANRVAYELRLPAPEVKRRIRRGQALRSMSATARALADGTLTARHADRLVRANRAEVADDFAAAEDELVEQARRRPFREWDGLVTRWERLVDPAQGEATADGQAAQRRFLAMTGDDGTGRLEGRLAPLPMAELTAELSRIEQHLFNADWKEARARLGDKATVDDLIRTPAQRSADALVEMARRSAACDLTGAAPAARFVVNVHTDQTTLLETIARLAGIDPADLPDDLGDGPVTEAGRRFCETAAGTPIAPTDMLLAAMCGRIRRVLYDPDGELVDHGRARRLFTGSLRDAVITRSRTCIHPDCDLPADRCEIDHRQSWEADGGTDIRNGDPACDHANRWKARHPDLWRQAIRRDQHRRQGSGTSDDRRMAPPRPPARK
jgi:hypothetical protein